MKIKKKKNYTTNTNNHNQNKSPIKNENNIQTNSNEADCEELLEKLYQQKKALNLILGKITIKTFLVLIFSISQIIYFIHIIYL